MLIPSPTIALSQPRFKVRHGPSGTHLFERKTGLNVLLDEVQPPRTTWAAAPRHVSIALTNACDLGCHYCYAPKNPAALCYERLTSWLDELDANGCLGVGFGGGEPTLYSQLADACHYAAHNTRLAVTLTTHAHHLSDALIDSLTKSVNFFRVSMDGVGTTYETLRGRSFDTLLHRLRALHNRAPFGINFVVNSHTFPDLDTATTLAADIGASEFLLLPEQPVRGKGGIDGRTANALKNWVVRYQGSVPLTISQAGADGMPICDPLSCESGLRGFAHIDASGALKRLSFDEQGVTIGPQGVMAALRRLDSKD